MKQKLRLLKQRLCIIKSAMFSKYCIIIKLDPKNELFDINSINVNTEKVIKKCAEWLIE